jgi:hypothetical protein
LFPVLLISIFCLVLVLDPPPKISSKGFEPVFLFPLLVIVEVVEVVEVVVSFTKGSYCRPDDTELTF